MKIHSPIYTIELQAKDVPEPHFSVINFFSIAYSVNSINLRNRLTGFIEYIRLNLLNTFNSVIFIVFNEKPDF